MNLKAAMWVNAYLAGQQCGVNPQNIDCVLKFRDDRRFRLDGKVSGGGRFVGEADQWSHPSRQKPIAKRKILERTWTDRKSVV